ncbi:hypothetical protein L1987_65363 [Smallanthus sonchifolius]|uniref:Uncharacterized protein n=1 Tax=Smallanthus sonchifolius TaxID=185202 RepID=A0ACB9BUH1_9ASTR|nr:hypothetical protein L1987_65363 [Smallanthus sonchifolius]
MTEMFDMLKTYELEMIQAKERSSSYSTASSSTTTSSALHSDHSEDLKCFHPDDLEEMDIQHSYAMLSLRAKRQAHQAQPRQQQQQHATPPAQTAACAAVGTADFDWTFKYEDLPANNQALMADTSEIPPQVYENLCTQACIDNQNLIDQNEEFHQMKSEFKKVENSYKEKIDCLKKEISSLKHEQTNFETQIDDLLVKLKATRAELADQKVHVEKFEFASKKLQRLLDAQIHEKVTAGIGFQAEQLYNAVPPPADYVAIHEPTKTSADQANLSATKATSAADRAKNMENHLLSNGKPRSQPLSLQASSLVPLNASILMLMIQQHTYPSLQVLGFLPLTRSLSCAGTARSQE